MKRWSLYAGILLAAIAVPSQAELRASLESSQIAPGETVQLTLDHDGRSHTQPDLSPLAKDFDILGRSSSSNIQIINGSVSSSTELQLTLSPKRTGRLMIPSLTWDSDHSAPVALNVTGASGSAAPTSSDQSVFIQTDIASKQPYVQAGVDVTVRLYASVPLSQASLDFGDTDAAWVRQSGTDETSTQDRNGTQYNVITRHYVVFPQHSGRVTIAGPTLSAEVPATPRQSRHSSDPFSDFFSNSPFGLMMGAKKPIRLHAAPIELNVRPRPVNASSSYWLPARAVSLQGSWHPDRTTTHVGDPITLDLKLRVQGLTAAQLPDLTSLLRLPAGVKTYPDQPQLKDTPDHGDLVGERDQRVALISDASGRYEIPELHLSWWNTETNQPAEVILPGRSLTILPATSGAVVAASPTQSNPATAPESLHRASPLSALSKSDRPLTSLRGLWPWISLGLAVMWMGTLLAWWRTARLTGRPIAAANAPPNKEPSEDSTDAARAKAAFFDACRLSDPMSARRHLLAWMNSAGHLGRVRGLNELARKVDDADSTRLLRELDRACYVGGDWNGAALASTITRWPKRSPTPDTRDGELAPLYP